MSHRLWLAAGALGLLVLGVWDAVLGLTGGLGWAGLGWAGLGWAGFGLGAVAGALWIRWALAPTYRWKPWQWVTALPLVPLPFFTRTGNASPIALGYESAAYLCCLVVLVIRVRRDAAAERARVPAPRPPDGASVPATGGRAGRWTATPPVSLRRADRPDIGPGSDRRRR